MHRTSFQKAKKKTVTTTHTAYERLTYITRLECIEDRANICKSTGKMLVGLFLVTKFIFRIYYNIFLIFQQTVCKVQIEKNKKSANDENCDCRIIFAGGVQWSRQRSG